MLAANARIVRTIFLEADATEILSDSSVLAIIELPGAQVSMTLRYIIPFMTAAQRNRVLQKVCAVASREGHPLPTWTEQLSIRP